MIWVEGHNLFVTLSYGISFVTIATLCAVTGLRARNTRLQAAQLDEMIQATAETSLSDPDTP